VTYTVPGRSIDVNGTTGTVNLNNNNQNITIPSGGNSATITNNGQKINVQKGLNGNSATVTNPSSSINANVNATTGQKTVELKYNGQTININANTQDLTAVVNQTASLDSASADAIISLNNNSAALIKNDNDLKIYGSLVASKRPAVESINVTSNQVEVAYTQQGRFLGIFKTNMPAKVIVAAVGRVKVKLPWYSFLVVKHTGDITTEIQSNLGSDAANINGSANSSATVQSTARVINVVSSSVQNHSTATVNANGRSIKVDSTGSVKLQDNARLINISR
jgi:hypothetical protein